MLALFAAGFLAACGSSAHNRTTTLKIRPITIDGHTITRVLLPPTVATTMP